MVGCGHCSEAGCPCLCLEGWNFPPSRAISGHCRQDRGQNMKPMEILGVGLIVLGRAGVVMGRFSYPTQEKVRARGPLQATAKKEHSIAIPDIAGIAAIIA